MKSAVFFCLVAGLCVAIAQDPNPPPNPRPDNPRDLCPHRGDNADIEVVNMQVSERGQTVELDINEEILQGRMPTCVLVIQEDDRRAASIAVGRNAYGGLGLRLVGEEGDDVSATIMVFVEGRN